jgi:hypothetical protein
MHFDDGASLRKIRGARLFIRHSAPDGEQATTDTMGFVMRSGIFHDVSARGAIPRGGNFAFI